MNPVIEARLKEWGHWTVRVITSLKALTLDMAADAFIGISLGENATRVNSAFVDTVAALLPCSKRNSGFELRRGMQGRCYCRDFLPT